MLCDFSDFMFYIWVYCCQDVWIHSLQMPWFRWDWLALHCPDSFHRRLCCSHLSSVFGVDFAISLHDAILPADLKTKPVHEHFLRISFHLKKIRSFLKNFVPILVTITKQNFYFQKRNKCVLAFISVFL